MGKRCETARNAGLFAPLAPIFMCKGQWRYTSPKTIAPINAKEATMASKSIV
jgi:hypothetical protein